MGMKERVEVYEQGTGQIIESYERDISPQVEEERAQAKRKHTIFIELDEINKRLDKLEGKS